MGQVIPYEVFRRKWREKRYGSDEMRINILKAMGMKGVSFLGHDEEIDKLLYGEDDDDEEDYWLGEKDLTQVIK